LRMAEPYGWYHCAAALAGLRQFDTAHQSLDVMERQANVMNDLFGIANVYPLRIRILTQQGRAVEACAIEPPDELPEAAAVCGEILSSRGLALACIGRFAEAEELAGSALATTCAIETRVLVPAIRAIIAVKTRASNMREAVANLVDEAFACSAVGLLITSYRASQDVMDVLLSSAATSERAIYALHRAGDLNLAESLGQSPLEAIDPRRLLSPREREVHDLACQGLTNKEIAAQLFISDSTVKLHLHHVYDKLGIRSRTALALNAARGRQATSATTSIRGESVEASRSSP
jgi:DNA-binding NarL/FixJ family response regulator